MNRNRNARAFVYYRSDFSQSTKLKIAEHMINSKQNVVYYRMVSSRCVVCVLKVVKSHAIERYK